MNRIDRLTKEDWRIVVIILVIFLIVGLGAYSS